MSQDYRLVVITALCLCFTSVTPAQEADTAQPQIIILKLDDITTGGAAPGKAVSDRWQRLVDYVQQADIKASCGVIGYSLEDDNPVYFQWIKDLHARGDIEFWNHGYRNRRASDKAGEFEGSYEQQLAALKRTQRLGKEKLGITFTAFGPHWSGTNEHTAKALDAVPELKTWFYGKTGSSKKLELERVLVLENPIFVPDDVRFRELYAQRAKGKKYLALQGHPNAWDDERWAGFVKIIEFLKSRGCIFMTPAEYAAHLKEH